MALVKCKACGKEVSKSAPTCPNCGESAPGLHIKCPSCGSFNFSSGQKGFGLGKAAELASGQIEHENTYVKNLRDKLENHILANVDFTHRNGHPENRVEKRLDQGKSVYQA